MSIVYSEGFENGTGLTDLNSRGTNGPVNGTAATNNIHAGAQARYPGGTAFAIGTNSGNYSLFSQYPNVVSMQGKKPIGFSVTLYTDSSGVTIPAGSGNIPNICYANGDYYLCNPINANFWKLSGLGHAGDGVRCTAITLSAAWAPTSVDYYNGYYYVTSWSNNGTQIQVFQYSALNGSAALASSGITTTTAGGNYGSSIHLFFDAVKNTAFVMSGRTGSFLTIATVAINATTGAPTVTLWQNQGVNDVLLATNGAVKWTDGNWYFATQDTDAYAMYQYSTDGGQTFALSTMKAAASSVCANSTHMIFGATDNGTTASLYVFSGGNNTAYTTVKITGDTITGNAMMVACNSSVYLCARAGGTTAPFYFYSTDTVNWKTMYLPALPSSQVFCNLQYVGNYFFASFTTMVFYSSDGIHWNVVPGYTAGSSSVVMATMSQGSNGGDWGFDSPTSVSYTANTNGTPATTKATITAPSTAGWHTYETNIQPIDWNTYRITYKVDEVIQNTTVFQDYSYFMNYANLGSVPKLPSLSNSTTSNGRVMAVNPNTGLVVATGPYILTNSYPYTNSWVSTGAVPNATMVVFINNLFYASNSVGIYTSSNGVSWTLLSSQLSGNVVRDIAYNGTIYVAVTSQTTGGIWTSTDGVNWTQNTGYNSSSGWATALYNQGQWILSPMATSTANGGATATCYYSTNPSGTWTAFTAYPSGGAGSAIVSNYVYWVSPSNVIQMLTLSPNAKAAPIYNATITPYPYALSGGCVSGANGYVYYISISGGTSAGAISVVAPGSVASIQNKNLPLTGTYSGVTTITLVATNMGLLTTYGPSTANSYSTGFVYYGMATAPFSFTTTMGSVFALDDLVMTQGSGTSGAYRVQKLNLNSNVQSQWSPTPAGSNVAAATVTPLSISSGSYIQAATVGTKDIYGNDGSYTVAANQMVNNVSVEAFGQALVADNSALTLGISVSGTEADGSANTLTSVGTNVFVKNQFPTNPATGKGFTQSDIASLEVVVAKTA